jgi:hypothetical protein
MGEANDAVQAAFSKADRLASFSDESITEFHSCLSYEN